MNIGITYDLRADYLAAGYGEEETAEFDKIDTIEAIEQALHGCGHQTDRIGHAKQLIARLAGGERWDLVFNIAEGLYGFGREAVIPAMLEVYQIPYTFSDPLVLALTLHKGMTKHVIRDLRIPTPDFAVVTSAHEIDDVRLPFPLFAKPVAEGTGKGISAISKVHDHAELRATCLQLLDAFRQPVLVETYLPGREFTVGIVGTGRQARVVGSMEVLLKDAAEQHAYSYINKARYEELVDYQRTQDRVAREAEDVALAAWRGLNCRDGGRIDIRVDAAGQPNFIEVNPLAGLHPVHSDLPIICGMVGISYAQLVTEILNSALERLPR